MSSRDLSAIDRLICQPLGRIIQEAFADGIKRVFSTSGSYAYGLQIYPSIAGSPTIAYYTGQFIYMGDIGSAIVSNMIGIMIGMKLNNALDGTGNNAFIRLYSHGTQTIDAALLLANSGGTPIKYLLRFEGGVSPWSNGDPTSGGGAANAKILCYVGGTECYIPLYNK